MKAFRRSLVALLLAALIPTAGFATYQLMHLAQHERHDAQAAMLDHATKVLALANARLTADLSIMQTLALSPTIDEGRFDVFQQLARRVADQSAGWAQVVLVDAATDQQVMNLLRPMSDLPLPAIQDETYRRTKETSQPAIGGIIPALDEPGSPGLVLLRAPVLRDGALRYVLSIGILTDVFQSILVSQLPSEGVIAAAIVDRNGTFIARSRDPERWIGKAATEFVRRATAEGRSGIYFGRLHEGIENYTAFNTSRFSGWSAHVALDAAVFDAPRRRSLLLVGIAGMACVALGAGLTVLILRERKEFQRAEARLQQMQRLDALGKMTGGIAHDFNNLLAIIVGNVDLVQRRLGSATPPQLERIAQAAERGEKLIGQMLAFARRQPLHPHIMDLNEQIRGMQDLLKRATRGDISMRLVLAEDLWPVEVDPVQLESALLNLVINARDAMPQGGTLAIATRNVPAAKASEGDLVEVSVRDTGVGIPPAVLGSVFDPFFTTKPPGQGTGLGLSMVHGFVGQSGGRVEISSEEGVGTTVQLLLPRSYSRPSVAARTNAATTPVRGQGNLLLVEDNAELRETTASWLRDLGYVVEQADQAAEALEKLTSFPAHLVFSDILMPGGMNGVEFAREVRRRHPGTEILLTSGDAAAVGAVDPREFTILQKPYHLDTLTQAIRRVLERRGSEQPKQSARA